MSNKKIIQAWTNPDYRASLSQEELAQLPANPAGLVELNAEDLNGIVGGAANAGRAGRWTRNCFKTVFGSRKQTCCPIW